MVVVSLCLPYQQALQSGWLTEADDGKSFCIGRIDLANPQFGEVSFRSYVLVTKDRRKRAMSSAV